MNILIPYLYLSNLKWIWYEFLKFGIFSRIWIEQEILIVPIWSSSSRWLVGPLTSQMSRGRRLSQMCLGVPPSTLTSRTAQRRRPMLKNDDISDVQGMHERVHSNPHSTIWPPEQRQGAFLRWRGNSGHVASEGRTPSHRGVCQMVRDSYWGRRLGWPRGLWPWSA
jgi:hypothetical protein